jgi:anti-sigma factor RsiW
MHHEFTSLMSLVLDREATPAQATALRQHIAGCSECTATWREWQAVDVRLAAALVVSPPASLMVDVAARLVERNAQRQRRRRVASALLLAWGGTLGALWLVTLVLAAWGYSHPLEAGLLLSSGAQVMTSLTELLSGAQSFLRSLGQPVLALLSACFVSLTAGLVLLWVWVMVRSDVPQGSVSIAE